MQFNSKNFMGYLKGQIEYRYGKALYANFNQPLYFHFIYGYFRIAIEIFKTLVFFCTFIKEYTTSGKNNFNSVGLYNTKNQRNALMKLRKTAGLNFALCNISNISILYISIRLFTWVIKFVFYPLSFLMARCKSGIFHSSMVLLVYWYNLLLLRYLEKRVSNLYISNDHVGDVFILSILARSSKINVHYVQHGAVKPEFPVNYFNTIYVHNRYYHDIYSKLSKNDSVNIVIYKNDDNIQSGVRPRKVDILIIFSHQFYLIPSALLIRKVFESRKVSAVRFHPSDRFALVKYRVLKLFNFNLLYSSSDQLSVEQDFERASIQICASSSVLLDAYRRNGAKYLIWYQPIGLKWDYYNLSSKLNVVSSLEGLKLK